MSAVLVLLWAFLAVAAGSTAPSLGPDFQDISGFPNVRVDLRYATSNNFMGENLYGDFKTPYLHKEAAAKLRIAAQELQKLKPGWKLLIYDALRPRSVQRKLWAKVKGTTSESYVMDPDKGSVHNFGFAVDLGLVDENGKEVDMGAGFDEFSAISQPRYEKKFLKEGKLSQKQLANRLVLRKAMETAGFEVIPNEWWHFDALPTVEVRSKYKIAE